MICLNSQPDLLLDLTFKFALVFATLGSQLLRNSRQRSQCPWRRTLLWSGIRWLIRVWGSKWQWPP